MKKRILSLLLMSALVFSLFLTGCGETSQPSPPPTSAPPASPSQAPESAPPAELLETVKIGFLGNLAGSAAYIGIASKLALEDYIEELNANGGLLGHKVELISYDYSIDPATETVVAMNRLVEQDKVIAVLGPSGSVAAVPLAPISNDAKVPVVVSSASNWKVTVSEETGEAYPYMFRVCFIDSYLGEVLAKFAYNEQGLRKVGILTQIGDAYSMSMTEVFTEHFTDLGGEIVAQLGYKRDEVEFRAQVTEANNKGAEALFIPASNYREAALASQQAHELGLEFKYLIGSGAWADELLEVAGEALEGGFIPAGISGEEPEFQEYAAEFAAKHPGQSANVFVYYSLDAMMLLEHAINKAGSFDGEAIRNELEHATDAQLFSELLTIDPDTHNPLGKTVNMYRIENSEFVHYTTIKPE